MAVVTAYRTLASTLAAGLALALAAGAAQARSFYIIQSGADAWTVMDPEGIERIGTGAQRRAWVVRVQRNILTGNPPTPGYVRTLTEYDCEANRTRWREFSAFSRSGALLVSKVNPNPEWGPADEASDTYAAHRVICEGGGGGSVVSAESVAKVVISLMGSWDPPPTPYAPPSAQPPAKTPAAKTPPAKASATKAPAAKAAPTKPSAVKVPAAKAPPAKATPRT
ncbi:surface-adhesin E family protein [Phenylobacterium sp.]|uniref:surface-adhesin E family protein n=1 Tax=Phenylobacterium sp. TaxID=1871053 RepID=UPI003D2AAAE8